MTDDWRGEHLIRGRVPGKAERQAAGMSVVSSLSHELRRRAGIPVAAKREHDKFVTRVFRDIHQIERMAVEAGATAHQQKG